MLDRILNRLEEWIIVTLIAAATIITFVAVVHRYGASNSVGLARWAGAHHLPLLKNAANWVYTILASIHLSWANELATYMFVWMAKFGAALGVRTGIHVGVDVFVKKLSPATRRPVIVFQLTKGGNFLPTKTLGRPKGLNTANRHFGIGSAKARANCAPNLK